MRVRSLVASTAGLVSVNTRNGWAVVDAPVKYIRTRQMCRRSAGLQAVPCTLSRLSRAANDFGVKKRWRRRVVKKLRLCGQPKLACVTG